MALQSANDRPGRGRVITNAVAGGALIVGLMVGIGTTVANAEPADPATPTVAPDPAPIVPRGLTGEAARAGTAAVGPYGATAPAAADAATASDTEPAPTTADEVLAIIYRDYDTGAGGGQLSNLIHSVMQLRSQGFKPSKANKDAIVSALDHRPNQGPLVAALQETLAYQQRKMAQNELIQGSGSGSGGGPATIGINQADPNNPGALGQFSINPGS